MVMRYSYDEGVHLDRFASASTKQLPDQRSRHHGNESVETHRQTAVQTRRFPQLYSSRGTNPMTDHPNRQACSRFIPDSKPPDPRWTHHVAEQSDHND